MANLKDTIINGQATINGDTNVNGDITSSNYVTGSWLRTTNAGHWTGASSKVAVLDTNGWVCYRTPTELKSDLGLANVTNNNSSTAITNITRSGTTFTATRVNGTTFTFTQQDNNTTYGLLSSSANGLAPSTASGNLSTIDVTKSQYVLTSDGKWHTLPDNSWNNNTYTLSSLGGITPSEVDSKISTAVASAYKYKGSCTSDKLPTTGQVTGDVWNLTNDSTYGKAGMNVAWNGTAWDALGSNVDLSNYALKSSIPSVSNATITIKQTGKADQTFTLNGGATTISLNDNNTTYSSLKNPYSLTIQGNGTTLTNGTYDGSAAKTVNITAASIGAAASNHNHDSTYLKLSGGTMTGAIKTGKSGGSWINGMTQTNSMIQWTTVGVRDGSRYDPIMWGKDSGDNVWNFGWSASGGIGFFGYKKGRTEDGTDGSLTFDPATGITSGTFSGSLSGNASSASSVAWSGVTGRPTGNLMNISTNASTSQFLRGDGTWATPAYPSVSNATITIKQSGKSDQTFTLNGGAATISLNDNNTWTAMKGATTSAAGGAGYVPAPAAGAANRYLRSDGTWATPPNTTYGVVSSTANGLAPSTAAANLSTTDVTTAQYVLTSDGKWHTLPDNAWNNTTYTLAGLGGVPTSRKINGKALTGDITLTATDVGAGSPNMIMVSDTQPTDTSCKIWIKP